MISYIHYNTYDKMCGIFSLLNNSDGGASAADTSAAGASTSTGASAAGTGAYDAQTITTAFQEGRFRGPEHSELKHIDKNTIFGFHRLAINGLDAISNQPMTLDNITLICNGEIYNYKELYLYIGIEPKTNSDCEIIIHLYKKYGIDYLLQLLDGVFAFVLYDGNTHQLYVARDPYGVRPLYVLNYKNTNIYGFASELKVLSVLMNHTTTHSNTNEGSINHILPGTYLTFQKDMCNNASKYDTVWKLTSSLNGTKYTTPHFSKQLLISKKSYIETDPLPNIYNKICNNLINAVKKRVIGTTNRPIACLLSGGLDSSLIAALVSKFYDGELETYSIGMKGSEDIKYAEKVALHINSRHTSIIVSPDDFFNAIPQVIHAIESYDTTTVRASVGNYLIGKYIAENSNAKVIFNGDGSDELMGGYLYFHKAPSFIEFDYECKRLLKDIYAFDVLRSDKCISSNGLEPRTPFLDRGWVDFYLSLPVSMRRPQEGQIEKHLIRSAFAANEPGLLPNDVLWRKKEAFSDGVSGHHKSWFEIIKDKLTDFKIPSEDTNYSENAPKTNEQIYYRYLYDQFFPNTSSIVPYFWMPRFIQADDPSARTLSFYNTE